MNLTIGKVAVTYQDDKAIFHLTYSDNEPIVEHYCYLEASSERCWRQGAIQSCLICLEKNPLFKKTN